MAVRRMTCGSPPPERGEGPVVLEAVRRGRRSRYVVMPPGDAPLARTPGPPARRRALGLPGWVAALLLVACLVAAMRWHSPPGALALGGGAERRHVAAEGPRQITGEAAPLPSLAGAP